MSLRMKQDFNEFENETSHCYKFDKEPLGCFRRWSTSWYAQEEMRWWAIANGPGINIGASSPLSTLKSAEKFCPFSTPLHICSTLAAAVFCAFLYSANVKAFFTSSLLCHLASRQCTNNVETFTRNNLHVTLCKFYCSSIVRSINKYNLLKQ